MAEVQAWPVASGSAGAQPTLSSKFSSVSDRFAALDSVTSSAGNDVNPIDTRNALQTDPYYEVDLGSDRYIETVKLWDQADLSSSTSYSVFVSEFNPIPAGATVSQIRTNQATTGIIEYKNVGTTTDSATAIRQRARWLRVQIQGTNQSIGFNEMEIYTPEGFVGSPNQGDPVSALQTVMTATGYHTRPNELIDLYALSPGFTTGGGFYNNWQFVGSAMSSSVPSIQREAVAPLYSWKITKAAIPPGVIPKGGIMGLYAQAEVHPGPGTIMQPLRALNASVVQDTFYYPYNAIQEADVYGPQFNLVSNELTPDGKPTRPPYLLKPMGTAVNTGYYALRSSGTYKEIPATLAAFNAQYGLGSGVNVKYYNKGDLGIGRNMTCARASWSAAGTAVKGIACAVSNYAPAAPSGSAVPIVFGDETGSLSLIKNNKPAFATVVMVKRDGSNTTMFGVYIPSTTPATTDPTKTKLIQTPVNLDSTGFNQAAPNNCMSCHGGSAGSDPLSQSMRTAFLPFDFTNMDFDVAPYDYATQAEKFRTLNNYISISSPTPAVADFIKGSYHSTVATSGTKFDPFYVPAGWSHSTAEKNAYQRVIKPYCRTCHMSQVQGVNNGLDMLKASDLDGIRATVLADVCKAHLMPHSQVTMKNLWTFEGRATFVNYFGRDDIDPATMSASQCLP